ncbi:MAG: type II toxin-antitoxin system death-on-curing family toxin [Candidatus Sericytochromatia bacterium]
MSEIKFLSKDSVLTIHKKMIDVFGGSYGIRDEGLLDSALEMPRAGFGDEYFHKTIFDKASAYLFHLVKNHPFIDGNKRIGFACMDTFLRINGYKLDKNNKKEIYSFVLEIASGNSLTKEQISDFLEKNSIKIN